MSILMVCCLFTFISSCDLISCKAHTVGERLHKVFGLNGLELVASGNIKLP